MAFKVDLKSTSLLNILEINSCSLYESYDIVF